MRVSIIPEDKRIIVDGKTVDLDDNDIRWKFDDEHIHAIQWKNNKGEIEYEDVDGEDPLPNKPLGEDDFDTIVKPYIDFFNTILNISEKQYLENKISEEKLDLKRTEELSISKMQEEENIIFIEDLQKQNKQVRDEYEKLADELEKVLEEKALSSGYDRLNESKKLLEKEEEIKNLELKKSAEYMQETSASFVERLEKMHQDLEDERNSFVEEKKQWIDYIQNYKQSLQDEIAEIEKSRKEERESKRIQDKIDEKKRQLEEENLEMMRQNLYMSRLAGEQNEENMHAERLLRNKEIKNKLDALELESKKIELERENSLNEIMIQQESLLMAEDFDDQRKSLKNSIAEEESLQEKQSKNIEKLFEQNQRFNDEFSTRKKELADISSRVYEETTAIEFNDEHVESIIDFIDEVSAEDFYNIIADSERKINSFPVGKAAKWFNELRNVLDSYGHNEDENDDDDEE